MKQNNTAKPVAVDKNPNPAFKKINLPWGLILPLIFSLLSAGGITLLLTQIPAKAKIVQKLRSQVLTTTISSQDATILQKMITDTTAQREELSAAFPTEESLLNFLKIFDNLKNQGVEVIRFSVDSDTPTKIGRNPSFLPMTINLKGDSKSIEKALQTISSSPYFIRPISFQYSVDQTGKQVLIQSQFHLFVSDDYTKSKSKS